jgi:hypothetical protein
LKLSRPNVVFITLNKKEYIFKNKIMNQRYKLQCKKKKKKKKIDLFRFFFI